MINFIYDIFHSILDIILSVIQATGYFGITIGMALESSFVPFPSEAVLIPAGYLAAEGVLKLPLVIFSGTLGSLLGALINYYIAFFVGRRIFLLERIPFLNIKVLLIAEKYFDRYGSITTFVCRFITVIRQYISFPAGLAKMNIWKFLFFTGLGAGIYVSIVSYLGYLLYENQDFLTDFLNKNNGLIMLAVVFVVIVLFFMYWFVKKYILRSPIGDYNKIDIDATMKMAKNEETTDIRHFKETGSTNTLLLQGEDGVNKLSLDSMQPFAVVVADSQLHGHGRLQRLWEDNKEGSLLFSVLLKSLPKYEQYCRLNVLLGYAICDALRGMGFNSSLKWPNDILINKKKVGGILIESKQLMSNDSSSRVVAGVGLNINVDYINNNLENIATSLKKESGEMVNINVVFAKVLDEIVDYFYLAEDANFDLTKKWAKYSETLGKKIQFTFEGEKISIIEKGIDSHGFLIGELENGSKKTFSLGEVGLLDF